MFEYILLDCIIKLNNERTMYNIYHLLRGRKSTQTLQDRNIFGLSVYYGIYRTLHRSSFEDAIRILKEKNYLEVGSNQTLHVTKKGHDAYSRKETKWQEYIYFNGAKFSDQAYAFSNSLQLLLQLLTHKYEGQNHFIPIIEDAHTQRFIKNIWKRNDTRLDDLLKRIFDDLYSVLSIFPSLYAACFVDRLTTYKKVGLSNLQLAQKYNISSHDAYLIFNNIIHYICVKIEQKHTFQFIDQLYEVTSIKKDLTISTKHTFDFFTNGYTVEEIALIRQLKMNTILDHMIEIAYAYPDINWDSFITDQEFLFINKTMKQLSTKKLKDIKQNLPESISYFQIKLAMALEKNSHGGEYSENG